MEAVVGWVQLVWRLTDEYRHTAMRLYLCRYPDVRLTYLYHSWLSPDRDRDRDGTMTEQGGREMGNGWCVCFVPEGAFCMVGVHM